MEQRSDYPDTGSAPDCSGPYGVSRIEAEGLYTLRLVYVLLFEPPALTGNSILKHALSNGKVLRVLAES